MFKSQLLFRRTTCLQCQIKQFFHRPPSFTTSAFTSAKQLPPRTPLPETDLQESFLRGSGPGGQKINKTSSAVQLKHLPTGIVVKSQSTRSRDQNRRNARRLLMDKLEVMEKGEESRVAIKAAAKARKKASKTKKARRKYRKIEEGKEEDGEGDKSEEGGIVEGEEDGVLGEMKEGLERTEKVAKEGEG